MEQNTKKIIWSSGAAVLITALIILSGGQLLKDDIYGCETRGIIMPCERLSKYYSLPNGKCWNSDFGNKLCRSGWTQDYTIVDEVQEPICPTISCPTCPTLSCPKCPEGDLRVISYVDRGYGLEKYYCDDCTSKGCGNCIRDDEIMMPFGG